MQKKIIIIILFSFSSVAFGQDPSMPKNTYTLSDLDKAPVVTYCALTKNPEMYRDKLVRVRGIYIRGFELSYLYDRICSKDTPPQLPVEGLSDETWVWFDDLYKSNTKPEVLNNFENLKKQQKVIDIITVGKFYGARNGGYGHMGYATFGFVIMRLEQAIQAPSREQ
jgi:hypothetical protein